MSKMDLKNSFIEIFEPTMKNKGFLRKDKIFHRIVNGKIVQLLSYYKYEGPEFTVQFSIQPLCSGDEYSTFMDDLRMCEEFEDVPSWKYEYQSDGFIPFLHEALNATKQRLLPVFDSVIKYDRLVQSLDNKKPRFFYSNAIFNANIAVGNYSFSIEIREKYIAYCIEANQSRWGTDYHKIPSTQKKFEEECEEYYNIKKAMDNHDHDYIKRYIYDQEQKSLKSYVKAFSTPLKYETFLKTGVLPFSFVIITS